MADTGNVNSEIVELAALLEDRSQHAIFDVNKPPPTNVNDWLDRDLQQPDYVLGTWLHTNSRELVTAPTGVGKTNEELAKAAAIAGGVPFLHWPVPKPRKVLYVDGEMSRRLLKQRVDDAVRRIGFRPDGLHILSHEDVENFAPLNTHEGQQYIDALIDSLGGIDYITFDNIMSLLAGSMKDTEAWAEVLPWAKSLTRRNIGQTWVHHAGLDTSRGYGDTTKTWQMDTVRHLEAVRRDDTDVCFNMVFQKARERTPDNRAEFADVNVALVADEWTWTAAKDGGSRKDPPPASMAFFRALTEAMIDTVHRFKTWPAVTMDEWKAACIKRRLIDPQARPDSARSLFSKHRRTLISAGKIRCENEWVWLTESEV